jgi:hypothetical protein
VLSLPLTGIFHEIYLPISSRWWYLWIICFIMGDNKYIFVDSIDFSNR